MKCSLCRVEIGSKAHALRTNPRGVLPVCLACCGPVERSRLVDERSAPRRRWNERPVVLLEHEEVSDG